MRRLLLVLAVFVAGACATVEVSKEHVPTIIDEAFADAGVEADTIVVADTSSDGEWAATLQVEGVPISVAVDAGRGSIVRIGLGESDVLDRAQLETVASYADNPSDRAAQRRRGMLIIGLIVVLLGVGYALAHRARLREAAEAEASPSE